jgi:hypothetical protein
VSLIQVIDEIEAISVLIVSGKIGSAINEEV